MNPEEVLSQFKLQTWTGGSFNLEPITFLMEELGSPQKELKYIHVTGTNGKGSTCAMLHRILVENNYTTGLFTSPALWDFREQIQVNHQLISLEKLGKLGSMVLEARRRMEDKKLPLPSQFEMTFALAILHFLHENVDICVIEVGLGGRLDATNVIPSPLVAVIGSISLDHTNLLGNNLIDIALEKSGIIKEGCKVALYQQGDSVTSWIQDVCGKKNVTCNISQPSKITKISQDKQGQRLEIGGEQYHLSLLGDHQIENLAVVLEVLSLLEEDNFSFSLEMTKKALSEIQWKGRFEYVGRNPDFILDGGHNVDGISATISTLMALYPNQKFRFLLGILEEKNFSEVLDLLAPLAHSFVTVTAPNPRAITGEKLTEYIKTHWNCPVSSAQNLEEALILLKKEVAPQDVLVALGSLYMIGPLREQIFKEDVH